MSTIHPDLSIPELIKFIKHSFRESEFDEVQNTLMDREKIMQVKMENLVTDCASLKKQIDLLENTQSFSVLEKCSVEEKLGRTQRRCEELDKETVQMGETIKILRCEKLGIEEKLENSHRKCEEMDQRLVIMAKAIVDMKRDKIDANQAMVELKRKEIEVAEAAGEMAKMGPFEVEYGEDALAEAGLSPFEPQRMVDSATVLFGKKRGADAKGAAARGSKKPRAASHSASPTVWGQQLELTGPTPTGSRPPTASPPHRPAEVVDLSGGEARLAGPLIQLEELPFPESIGRVARWLEAGVKKMSADFEDEKDRYSGQLTAARVKLSMAKDEVKAVKAELAAQLAKTAEAELKAEKAQADLEAELKAARDGQGEALRAYTRRLLLSGHFTGLANELAGLINGNAAVDALEEAAKDFPDLDVSKYGYERLEGAAIFTPYAAVVRGQLGQLPLLDELAGSSKLLTTGLVAACSVDRISELDAAFEALPVEMEVDEEEQEAGAEETAGGPSSSQPSAQEKEVGEP